MQRNLLYQLFCGRMLNANILDHPGQVLQRMADDNSWQKLAGLGFEYIYLLGVWDTTGPVIINDEAGIDITNKPNRRPSPFAITDHTKPNPELGTADDLKKLLAAMHQKNLKVIVDFVPNHTGTTHPFVKDHPHYYKNLHQAAFSGDVVELDYTSQAVRNELTEVLLKIFTYGIDGVRCDMAHLVPTEFWQEAIGKVRSEYPQAIFLAEAYSDSVFRLNPQQALLNAGFTAVYDEPLYRNMKQGTLMDVIGHFNYIRNYPQPGAWVHYCANHDDPFPQSADTALLWQVLFLCLPGWHLIYNGFLQGKTKRLAHHYIELLTPEYQTEVEPKLFEFIQWIIQMQPECLSCSVNGQVVTVIMKDMQEKSRITIDFESAVWQKTCL